MINHFFYKLIGFFILLPVLISSANANQDAGALISRMLNTFALLDGYSATLTSKSAGKKQVIRYYFKKPGFIKMIFVTPHEGASLGFNPITGKAILHPYEHLGFFSLSLSPDNALIQSPQGHTVDKSDINHLLIQIQRLYTNGTGSVRTDSPSSKTITLEVKGKDGFSVVDQINRYVIVCSKSPAFPREVNAYTSDGTRVETIMIDDLKIDPVFTDDVFDFSEQPM